MGTATGLTAARMQQIIDQQIVAGAIDLSGHLIMEREDGSTFDAGQVKGDKGDSATYEIPNFPSNSSDGALYVRLAVLDGINTSTGASAQFMLSGIGRYVLLPKATVLVHVAQRGSNTISAKAWSWGLDEVTNANFKLFTRQTGEFMYEVWALFAVHTVKPTYMDLAKWRATLYFDSHTAVAPSGLVEFVPERSDSPMATQTLAGISELATNAEVQAGTDAVRTVTPAGLASVVGVGVGYRFVQRVVFTSSGTFLKASYPGVRAIRVLAVGGGGSGAGAGGASGGMNSYGTGGGSGAYAESFITNIAGLAASTTVTVGAGGSATAAGAIDGNAGSASSFGTLVVAGGGGGGYAKPNTTLGGYVQGGLPGVATAGDIQQGGSPGGQGAGRDTLSQSGNGGSSIFGGGGFGPATGAGSGANAGNPGTAWGAGGSGAATNAGGTARVSGAGASGVVIVEIYR